MKSQYVLPITIVVAGVLIAGAVFLAGKSGTAPNPNTNPDGSFTARPYTPGVDHILGNPNAKVKVVEYADLECPYCKTFNTTMYQVMDYYGGSATSRGYTATSLSHRYIPRRQRKRRPPSARPTRAATRRSTNI